MCLLNHAPPRLEVTNHVRPVSHKRSESSHRRMKQPALSVHTARPLYNLSPKLMQGGSDHLWTSDISDTEAIRAST